MSRRGGADSGSGTSISPGRLVRWSRDLVELLLPAACAGCGERLPLHHRPRDRARPPEGPVDRICLRCRSRLRPPPLPRCARCGLPRGSGGGSAPDCEECRAWPPVLKAARSAVVLEPPADRLIHALKYGGWRELAGPMGRRIARLRLPPAARGTGAVVVPVPTTRARRRRRGYNQAGALAAVVAEDLGLRLIPALRRRSGGRTQVALQPAERDRNVRRAFSLRPGESARVRRRTVLLVDDVLTTGATAMAASRALESAGVEGVVLLTFARALPYRTSS